MDTSAEQLDPAVTDETGAGSNDAPEAAARRARCRRGTGERWDEPADSLLVREGDIAADYLERLLDIADYDGDIDLDVENDRAVVAVVGSDLRSLVGRTARPSTRCRS